MYHMVAIPPVDQHVHRFLRRSYETERERDIYVKMFLTFGDRLSANDNFWMTVSLEKKSFHALSRIWIHVPLITGRV